MIKTEAGEKMKEENPVDKIDTIDGQELLRQELEKEGKKFGMPETPEMNMGGLMNGGMGVIIGIEEESGNEIPAGSMPEEVADDIDAKLSEGEYVIPADVVRWHGVKTFEQMRCEAKMGLGLMAEDGRIAEVDGEAYEHDHDDPNYDIEEKDKPKVEKAEYEVVEAAEGVTTAASSTLGVGTNPNYTLASRYNPNTNRIEYYYLDPVTGQEVSQEEFQPDQSTRFDPTETVMREVYGRTGDEIPDCGEGFVYDEVSGSCVPIEAPAVSAPSGLGGDGGEEPTVEQAPTPYNYQLSTKIADYLGPLSAEDLEDYEGATLAGKALSRATEQRPITPLQMGLAVAGGPIGVAGLAAKQTYNEVGAKRAAMTRQEQLGIEAEDLLGEDARVTTRMSPTYNLSFDPNKAAFNATTTATISELQRSASGSAWATDYVHTDSKGNEIDPWNDEADWGSLLDQIDAEISGQSAVTGASPGNEPSGGDNDSYSGPSASEMDSGSQDQVSESTTDDDTYSGPE
jgi:hypothetical protein